MEKLPDELLGAVLQQVNPVDIIALSSTCRRFNAMVTSSIPIQLILHQYLYSIEPRPITGSKDESSTQPADPTPMKALRRLVQTERNYNSFNPATWVYSLDEDEEVVDMFRSLIVTTALGYRMVPTTIDRDTEGKWDLCRLYDTTKSGEKELESRQLKVPFEPIRESLLVSIEKNVLLVGEKMVDPLHRRVHVFRLPKIQEGGKLEYSGVGVLDLGNGFGQVDSSRYGAKVRLGPRDLVLVTRGYKSRLYSWMDGSLRATLVLPTFLHSTPCVETFGQEFLVVDAEHVVPREEDPAFNPMFEDQYISKVYPYIFIYRIEDLTSASLSEVTRPTLVLRLPSAREDFPPHVQAHIPTCEYLLSQGSSAETSPESDILRIISFFTHSTPTGSRIAPSSTTIFTVKGINELILQQRFRPSRTATVSASDRPVPFDDMQILEPHEWWKYSFMPLGSDLNERRNCRFYGSRLMLCEMASATSVSGQTVTQRRAKVVMYDFNSKTVKGHPQAGVALGGLGGQLFAEDANGDAKVGAGSLFCAIVTSLAMKEVSADSAPDQQALLQSQTFESVQRSVMLATDSSLGATRYEGLYEPGLYIDDVVFDGGRYVIQSEDSLIEVFDFGERVP